MLHSNRLLDLMLSILNEISAKKIIIHCGFLDHPCQDMEYILNIWKSGLRNMILVYIYRMVTGILILQKSVGLLRIV